ncbi:hypothetical protein [Neptunicella marina]|uniref:Glycine zipper family protein n=1 Tax=Neptunicella marina TaxID=2125989 RepID=A0A8J6IWY0_9ALTE|nr:hypothetical protein [Neptunicella marina]MBC3767082.1 hypothetical protein [Neptunicella marina]
MQQHKQNSPDEQSSESEAPKGSMGMGVLVGLIMGAAYGVMSGQFAQGIATGIALGVILGGVLQFNARMQKHQQQQGKEK